MIKLFPYQAVDAKWLAPKNQALLAHEMGVGKTYIAIEAFLKAKCKRVLIVCPAVAKVNWQKELEKYAGIKAQILETIDDFFLTDVAICSFNYAASYGASFPANWDLIIIDEAHFLKNPESQRAKTIVGSQGLIHKTKKFWALTGTPAPNHAGETWVWLYVFGLTKMSYEGFINKYCQVHQVGGFYGRMQISGTNTKNSPELKSLLKRFSIRRLKKDVLDLPPMTHNTYYIEGASDESVFAKNPELKEKLELELQLLKEKLDITVDFGNTLSALNLLSQSVSSLRRYHGFKKLPETAKLIDFELKNEMYNKIIVFGIHTDILKELYKKLSKYNPAMIIGATKDKQSQVDKFQTDNTCKIFLGNILAAGTAITLTAASEVIFIERDWVPGNNQQAADRAHRIGQTSSVNCRHIVISNSIDEKISETIVRKLKEISTFI